MDKAPSQALSPDSQDWRRWVETNLVSVEKLVTAGLGPDITNSFKASAGNYRRLSQQVSDLQEQQSKIAQAQLEAAQALAKTNETVAYLQTLKSSSAATQTGGSFGGGGWWQGPATVLACPTGSLKVTVSGGVSCGIGAGNRAGLTYQIGNEVLASDQLSGLIGGNYTSGRRDGLFCNNINGGGGEATGSFVHYMHGLTPGTKTIQAWAWASGPLIVAGGVTISAEVIPAP